MPSLRERRKSGATVSACLSADEGERVSEKAFLTVRLEEDLVRTARKREGFDGEEDRGEEAVKDGGESELGAVDVEEGSTGGIEFCPDPGRGVAFASGEAEDEIEDDDDGGGEGERAREGIEDDLPARPAARRPPGGPVEEVCCCVREVLLPPNVVRMGVGLTGEGATSLPVGVALVDALRCLIGTMTGEEARLRDPKVVGDGALCPEALRSGLSAVS